MSVELAPKTNSNSEKQPKDETNQEDFSWFEEHPHNEGFSTDIEARLAPESLSEDKKNELMRLEAADDPVAFVEAKADLPLPQQHEYEEYRRKKSLLDLQEKDPKEFAERIQTFSDRQRNDFYVFEKQAAEDKARLQQNIAERRANPQTEDDTDNLLLYSQKFQDPIGFQENYKNLTVKQQTKFRVLERKEDARVQNANSEFIVPELTMDGEAWVSRPASERRVNPEIADDLKLTAELRATHPDGYNDVRYGLNPDQSSGLKAHEKLAEMNQVDRPAVDIRQAEEPKAIAEAYEPVAYSQATEHSSVHGDEWTKGAKRPGMWSKVKRLFGRKK